MNFEVVGKISGNFLVYKNNHSKSYLTIYDNDMVEKAKEDQKARRLNLNRKINIATKRFYRGQVLTCKHNPARRI